jgi:hypothetical protein
MKLTILLFISLGISTLGRVLIEKYTSINLSTATDFVQMLAIILVLLSTYLIFIGLKYLLL